MSIAQIAKDYGPQTALAVSQVTGAEDKAIERAIQCAVGSGQCAGAVFSAHRPLPTAHPDADPERWDGMG